MAYALLFLFAFYSDFFVYFEPVFAAGVATASVVCVIASLVRKSRRLLVHATILGVSFACLALSGAVANIYVDRRANELVGAIERYKQANGTYPLELKSLAPDFVGSDIVPSRRKLLLVSRYYYLFYEKEVPPRFGYARYPLHWTTYNFTTHQTSNMIKE